MKLFSTYNKKWIGGIVVFSIALILASCTKLVNKSHNTLIASQFHPTSEDLASLEGPAYRDWRVVLLQWNGLWRAQELSADEEVIPARPNGWVDGGVYRRLHEHKWTTDADVAVNTWNRTYAGITDCNRVIYQIQSGSIPVAASDTTSVLAEMRLLRASYYWVLCDFFGNVPIITKFDVPAGYLPKQSTRKQVYDFIVQQLMDNIPNVSAKNDQSTYGKFNKWAGLTLLAKMYLNAGVYSGTPEWDKVISTCDQIINSGLFQLDTSQKDIFKTNNSGAKGMIFALPFDDKYTTSWNAFDIHMETLEPENQATYNLKYAPWGGMCLIPQFVSTFDTTDARYTKNFIRGQQYSASGEKLMGTLGAYSGKPLSYVNYVPGVDSSQEVDGFRLGKFEIAMGATNVLSNDYPLFRYADVLMMKAEALLRTGHADEAATIVTKVRQRDFPNDPSKATVTGAELMQGSSYDYGLRNHLDSTNEGGANIKYGRFLDELGYEFNQEGRRRTDMIRFGAFTTKSWLSHKADNDPHYRLFPIPRPELEKNSNLHQNPGY